MESEYRKGYVYIQNHFAGIIAETEEGYTFAYDEEYLTKISKNSPTSLGSEMNCESEHKCS